ncbi:hypothetical protein CEXT_713151 [Caerostris extrusa]|uniref:Uncharacterized protein n=1 Tax=Caerostris extrusa TaxID=172846 RepID=A0AAV4VMW0_CAEEX|nr:hypothetical protein CEXT_713151 [Caerostris extrusa]
MALYGAYLYLSRIYKLQKTGDDTLRICCFISHLEGTLQRRHHFRGSQQIIFPAARSVESGIWTHKIISNGFSVWFFMYREGMVDPKDSQKVPSGDLISGSIPQIRGHRGSLPVLKFRARSLQHAIRLPSAFPSSL